jgi:O-antigen/teichoic acid export membrane protein
MLTAMFSAMLRFSGMAMRFLLSVFMVKYMSLSDIGGFSLMLGVTGLLPSLAGFGLNYFMSRDLVGTDRDAALAIVRDRLMITCIAATACVLLLVGAAVVGVVSLPMPLWLGCAVILLELVGVDLQVALLARGKPMAANINLLLRSGLWNGVYVAAAFAFPALRSLSALAVFWLAGLVVSHLLLLFSYRADWHEIFLARSISRSNYLKSVPPQAILIYISELGLSGSLYIDRFIITAFCGLASAGTYFFFSSIVGAVYTICISATVQIFLPQLRAAYTNGGLAGLDAAMWPRFRQTAGISIVLLGISAPVIWMTWQWIGHKDLQEAVFILPILLIGYAMKIASEFFSVSLAAAQRDREYAGYHMASLVLTVGIGCIAIPFLGSLGAAVALLVTSAALVAVRCRAILSARRLLVREVAAS